MVSDAFGLKTMASSAFCRKLQGNLQSLTKTVYFLVDPGATFAPGAGGNVVQKWVR